MKNVIQLAFYLYISGFLTCYGQMMTCNTESVFFSGNSTAQNRYDTLIIELNKEEQIFNDLEEAFFKESEAWTVSFQRDTVMPVFKIKRTVLACRQLLCIG